LQEKQSMTALDPAMVHELALFVFALATLIKAIWPNGIRL
jgi:hypothetical protein